MADAQTSYDYDQEYRGDYRTKVVGYEVARQDALSDFISNVLKLGDAKNVLDYGCGNGLYVPFWGKLFPSAELHHCDISTVALDKLKEDFPEQTDRCYELANNHLDFEDNSFDVIVSVEVMEHVEDLIAYISDINRLLKPGGYFVWTTPCANAGSIEHTWGVLTRRIETTSEGYNRWKWETPAHLRRLKTREIEHVLMQNGYDDVSFRMRSHFFSFVCSRFPRRMRSFGEKLMKLDYRWFGRLSNGASMLGGARKKL